MKKYLPGILAVIFLLMISVSVAYAQPAPGSGTVPANPPGHGTVPGSNVSVTPILTNPFSKGGNSLIDLFNAILKNIVLPIGGVIIILAFIYSGFLYVSAQGDENKVSTAHRAFLYTAVGAAILLGAEAISVVISNTISSLK
ncbi:MAG: protein of unknown function with transrane region [Parcubacteria group bacterium]|nr:protein of unknown function with transrane region [Parcubacteria group bacterium]